MLFIGKCLACALYVLLSCREALHAILISCRRLWACLWQSAHTLIERVRCEDVMFAFANIAAISSRPRALRFESYVRNASRASPPRWRAKLRVSVLNIGRHSSKDATFDDAVTEYARRLRPTMDLELRWVRPDVATETVLSVAKDGAAVVCLDGRGKLPKGSEGLSEYVFERLERGGSRLTFVIGDAEGLPSGLVGHAMNPAAKPTIELLSLGPLTLTHKMVRVSRSLDVNLCCSRIALKSLSRVVENMAW